MKEARLRQLSLLQGERSQDVPNDVKEKAKDLLVQLLLLLVAPSEEGKADE